MGLVEKKEKRLYEGPVITIAEVEQGGVICVSGIRNDFGDTNDTHDTHWTVDHETEEITPDDEWEEEQEQDWGDSWGDY